VLVEQILPVKFGFLEGTCVVIQRLVWYIFM